MGMRLASYAIPRSMAFLNACSTPIFYAGVRLGGRVARFVLVSPCTRDEIERRLRNNIDSGFNLFGSNPIVGWADRERFNLRVRIGYRNSFQTILRGRLIDAGDGTRIRCQAGMPIFSIAFMTVWFSLIGSYFVAALPHLSWRDPGDVVAIALPAFGVALVAIGRWIARDELAKLVAFLEDKIDAERAR
jgi:hypothetical protein